MHPPRCSPAAGGGRGAEHQGEGGGRTLGRVQRHVEAPRPVELRCQQRRRPRALQHIVERPCARARMQREQHEQPCTPGRLREGPTGASQLPHCTPRPPTSPPTHPPRAQYSVTTAGGSRHTPRYMTMEGCRRLAIIAASFCGGGRGAGVGGGRFRAGVWWRAGAGLRGSARLARACNMGGAAQAGGAGPCLQALVQRVRPRVLALVVRELVVQAGRGVGGAAGAQHLDLRGVKQGVRVGGCALVRLAGATAAWHSLPDMHRGTGHDGTNREQQKITSSRGGLNLPPLLFRATWPERPAGWGARPGWAMRHAEIGAQSATLARLLPRQAHLHLLQVPLLN